MFLSGKPGYNGARRLVLQSVWVFALEVAGLSQPAIAQVATPPARKHTADKGTISDVIVTAERRSARLQDVPISVTALSAKSLVQQGITNTSELSQVTPGLSAPESLSGNAALTPFIRGVGSATAVPGIDSSVALYIDGVYQASKYQNQIDLANIDRVEVLEGPQGTLYGRNAAGGAINIITKRPSDVFEGDASVTYGSFNDTKETGYITGPLAPTLNGSLGIVANQGGDYVKDPITGHDSGGLDSQTVNARLAWDPIDQLKIDLSGTYADRDARRFDDSYAFGPGSVPLGSLYGGIFSTNSRLSYTDVDPVLDARSYAGALNVRYSLDAFDLVSISAYKEGTYHSTLDSDGTSEPLLTIRFSSPSREFTQELQAQSTGSTVLQWIAGAFFIHDTENYAPFEVDELGSPPVQYFSNTGATAGAVFGQATYKILEGTRLTAGLRYSIERRTIDNTLIAPTLGNLVLGGPVDEAKTFEKLTWRFSLDHKFSENILGYISDNRGFKSGAYNPLSVAPNLQPVAPEILDAYEIGIKTLFADRRVQVDASGYYYDYKNIQVQHVELGQGNSVAILENAAAATLYGIDGDVIVRPIPPLQLRGGFNLEKSKYDSYQNASGFAIINGFSTADVVNMTGQQVIAAPSLTFDVAGTYDIDLTEHGSVQLATNYSYTSTYKTEPGEGNDVKDFGLLNASIAYTDVSGRYTVQFWGHNLTNVKVYGTYSTALAYSLSTRPPLSVGVTLSTKF